jgi:multidrug resistance protein
MASLAIFPVFWSSFSEVLGRRSVYVISFGILTVFNVLSAVSINMPMFLVMRILSGGASGSVQAVGAGTIADIWHVRERGNAMAMYYLGPLMGPLLAPIIGGALQIRFGWRSTMWFNSIYGIFTFLLLVFCLPETIAHRKKFGVAEPPPPTPGETAESQSLGPSLSRTTTRQSIKDTSKLVARILNGLFIQPLAIVQYLQFPPVLLTIYYACVTFCCLYMLQISVQDVFSKPPYNFSTLDVGLTYIPASLGYAVCSLFAGRWTDYLMAREARKAGRRDANGRLVYLAEDRMRENAWIAAILYPSALVWWGWASEKGLFWLVPVRATFHWVVMHTI